IPRRHSAGEPDAHPVIRRHPERRKDIVRYPGRKCSNLLAPHGVAFPLQQELPPRWYLPDLRIQRLERSRQSVDPFGRFALISPELDSPFLAPGQLVERAVIGILFRLESPAYAPFVAVQREEAQRQNGT